MNGRCAALDAAGRRCRRPSTHSADFLGDSQYREPKAEWVRVRLCEKHRIKQRRTKPRDYFNPRDVAILGGDPSL